VFKDKEGKTLMTKNQYAKKTKITDEKELAAEFNNYLKENQASIAYFECYVPIYDERFVADFADEKGNIDINKIKQACPELLDMVGYRIPTEAKYSMVPIRIKGFLPRTAGEGIMLPAEITTLSGSDFDIDKLYLMRYSFNRQEVKDKGGFIYDYLAKKGVTSENIAYEYRRAITLLNGEREADLSTDDEEMLEEWSKSTLMEVRYSLPKSGREYNNNVMLATQWAMLTSEQAMPQILSPGNFEEPKRVGYLISALEQAVAEGEDAQKAYEKLSKMDVDALKDASYRKKSLLYANTQMQFHKQNMVAAKLIGVFAQANVSHAFIGLSETPVDINFVNPFTIRRRHKTTGAMVTEEWNGNKFIDKEYDADGVNRVSATLAAYLAASVDAVKDPILNLMNINMSTANIAVTLARLGYNAEFIGLFLSQPIIKKLVVEFNRQNAIQKTSIKEILKAFMDEMQRGNPDLQPVEDAQFVVDETMLISNIGNENTDINDDYNILGVFRNILMAADAFRLVTHMTRYNSITAAVGPSAANTAVSRIMDGEFIASPYVTDSLREAVDNPILRAFRDGAYNIEEQLLGQNFIQASNMYGFLDALTVLYNRLGYMSEKTARSFSDFFMSYYVNMKNSVFDLSIDNRRYMIDEFPLEFQKLKSAYKDNVFLSSIQLTKDKAGNPILQLKTKGLDSTETQNLRSSWADLFIQERSEGKEIKDMLSIKLVEYNFFMGSFGFSPKTFMSLVPGIIREYLPNYVDNLTDGHVIKDKSLDINNLVGQFQLNTGITDIRQMEQKDMGLVPLDSMPNWYSITNTDLPELKAMGKRNAGIARIKDGNVVKYALVRNFNGVMRLRFVNKLGGDKQGFEIDPATDFVNMETVWESTTSDTSSADNAGEDPMMDYYRQADAENEARGIQKQQFEVDELEEVDDIVLDAISSAFPNVSTQGVRFRGIESAVERTLDAVLDNSTEEEKQSLREEINKVLDDKNIC